MSQCECCSVTADETMASWVRMRDYYDMVLCAVCLKEADDLRPWRNKEDA